MKSFIFAVILLTVIIGIVAANSFAVLSLTNDLFALVTALPYPPEAGSAAGMEEVLLLSSCWDRYRGYLHIVTDHSMLDGASDTMARIVSAYETGDASLYSEAVALFSHELSRIREQATFSLSNLV